MTELYGKESTFEKMMKWGCIALFVAFLIALPFMIMDKQEREAQLWQDLGCRKYDEVKQSDVPAKCANTFTDHYKPQEQRVQPPDER